MTCCQTAIAFTANSSQNSFKTASCFENSKSKAMLIETSGYFGNQYAKSKRTCNEHFRIMTIEYFVKQEPLVSFESGILAS